MEWYHGDRKRKKTNCSKDQRTGLLRRAYERNGCSTRSANWKRNRRDDVTIIVNCQLLIVNSDYSGSLTTIDSRALQLFKLTIDN